MGGGGGGGGGGGRSRPLSVVGDTTPPFLKLFSRTLFLVFIYKLFLYLPPVFMTLA